MIFKVEIAVTNDCNLNCLYCYNNRNKIFLSVENFEQFYANLIDLMFQAHCEKYSLALFGGEPFLNWELCKYIIKRCHDDIYCENIVIVSNLLLLNKKIVNFISKYKKVGVSWSFDGIYNDIQRPNLNKTKNIDKYILKKDLILSIVKTCKVMLTPDSLDLVKNAEFLMNYGLKTIDFTPVYDNIWGEKDIKLLDLNLKKLNQWYKNNLNKIQISFYRDFILQCINSRTFVRKYPCFAGTTGLCLSANGKLYPCQRFASNNENEIINFKNHLKSFEKLADRTIKCKNCDIYAICPVGCTFSIIKNNGLIKNICKIHKIIYNNVINFYKY